MARTTLTRTTPLGSYPALPVAANALDVTMTGADTSNQNQILLDGPMLVIAQNTDTASHNITITSAADPQNRTGDIASYAVAAGKISVLKVTQVLGWLQSDGYLYLQADSALVKLGAIRL